MATVSIVIVTRVPVALSLGLKRPGREADHSSPTSAEVKNAWSFTSNTPSWRGAQLNTGTILLYFTFERRE
jgi:hypothetical protein